MQASSASGSRGGARVPLCTNHEVRLYSLLPHWFLPTRFSDMHNPKRRAQRAGLQAQLNFLTNPSSKPSEREREHARERYVRAPPSHPRHTPTSFLERPSLLVIFSRSLRVHLGRAELCDAISASQSSGDLRYIERAGIPTEAQSACASCRLPQEQNNILGRPGPDMRFRKRSQSAL